MSIAAITEMVSACSWSEYRHDLLTLLLVPMIRCLLDLLVLLLKRLYTLGHLLQRLVDLSCRTP